MISRLVVLALVCLVTSCAPRSGNRWLVVSEAVHFGVEPGAGTLNLPVFAGTLGVDNIVHDVSLAEYYHRKFASVYGEKSFEFIADSTLELLLDLSGPLPRPQSVYSYDNGNARIELDLFSFDGTAAHYMFRVTDKATGQVRNHQVEVPPGQSASIGMLFDAAHERGYLVAVSVQAVEITKDLSPDEFATFLRQKNTPRGVKTQSGFRAADQKWMDELFGERAIRLTEGQTVTQPTEEQPFDVPPTPVGGIEGIVARFSYPEAAKRDAIEGRMVIAVNVDTLGVVSSCRIVRGLRADLDSVAVAVVRDTKFTPAMYQGKPVSTTIMIPIAFKLD